MIAAEHLEAWRGQTVLDPSGETLGKLEEVYLDSGSQEPILIAVKSGLLGRHVSLIPVNDATVGPDYVRVAHDQESVDRAGSGSAEGVPDAAALASLGSIYGLRFADRLELESASDVEARRAVAEEARRRAEELEIAAQQRESERDAARQHAQGAGQEATQAEREAAEARRAADRARSATQRPGPPEGQA